LVSLAALILLPLAAIGLQLSFGLHGAMNSLYKLCFIIPPLVYCQTQGIGVFSDILKFRNWRRCLGVAIGLAIFAIAVFWSAYYLLGDLLLDKEIICLSIGRQFIVNSKTVLLVAPITIFLNSLVEEFFYRGFAFGLLSRRHRLLGYLLPAAAFTTQHVLFFCSWLSWIPFCVAVAGLLVFALVLQRLYETADSIVAPWVVHMGGDVAMMGIAVVLLMFPR
jgi:CAAX protease family protein